MSLTERQAQLMHEAAAVSSPADLDPVTLHYVRGMIARAIVKLRPEVEAGSPAAQVATLALFAACTDIADLADLADLTDVSALGAPPV